MDRRHFIRACAASSGMALCTDIASGAPVSAKPYARARLLDAAGDPLRASALATHRNYVFLYPFQSTPCFLLNLGRSIAPAAVTEPNQSYAWPGGVGPKKSVVAYSAICSHQLTYPTKDISFISFRAGKTGANKHADVIHCCSEHSQYDPARGAQVVAGPAPRPLAAILLEHDPTTDALYATGTLGTEVFNEFFRKYEFKLTMELGGRAKQSSDANCRVTELDNYCRQQVKC